LPDFLDLGGTVLFTFEAAIALFTLETGLLFDPPSGIGRTGGSGIDVGVLCAVVLELFAVFVF
jgi:hypothetical protein